MPTGLPLFASNSVLTALGAIYAGSSSITVDLPVTITVKAHIPLAFAKAPKPVTSTKGYSPAVAGKPNKEALKTDG